MILQYRYASAAEDEVAQSILFYRDISFDLARDFVRELDQIIDLLRSSPKIGTPLDFGFRKFPLKKFPFSLYYEIRVDVLVIVAVGHHSRQPDYWKSRIS